MMKLLDISEEEAMELINADKAIDKGEKLFELSAEQKKVEKKMKNAQRAVDAYGKTRTRERKENPQKRMIIQLLAETLRNCGECSNINVENIEKIITFSIGEDNFKIDLIKSRNKKQRVPKGTLFLLRKKVPEPKF